MLLCCYSREKPFGLIIILDGNGDAEGDLFYDDGESIDTIESKSYFYATYRWSLRDRSLIINVTENNYPSMSSLVLNTLTIYGLNEAPYPMTGYGNNRYYPKRRPFTEITDVIDLGLPMSQSYTLTWSTTEMLPIELSSALLNEPKYRVDCHPDPGNEKTDFSFAVRIYG